MFADTTTLERPCTTVDAGPFQVRFAVGGEPRLAEYELRYRAFVEEHGWEAARPGAHRIERDAFDDFSCSVLLLETGSARPAACQRLILPDWLPPGILTNVQREYAPLAGLPAVDFNALPTKGWAEVSRLTIAPEFRSGSAGAAKRAVRTVTYASLALAMALDREVLFSMSDPRIVPLMRRMHLTMRQVGAEVDFHGLRAPFQIDVAEVFATVPEEWSELVGRLIVAARSATAGIVHDPGTSHAA